MSSVIEKALPMPLCFHVGTGWEVPLQHRSITRVSSRSSQKRASQNSMKTSLRPGGPPYLIFVTPNGICKSPTLAVSLTRQAVAGGVTLVQIRDEHASIFEKLAVTRALLDAGIPPRALVLSGVHPEEACGVSSEIGVHIKEANLREYLPIAANSMSSGAAVGCSIHSVKNAEQAAAIGGASYLQIGTMYPTRSHPGKTPEGPALMKAVHTVVGRSETLIGIGGITKDNLGQVFRNGADGIATISSISAARNPTGAAGELMESCRQSFSKIHGC